jgi:hypothetical protein
MPTQLLIYETAVPLSFAQHRDSFVEVGTNYAFSGNVNSVPLMAVEFPQAAAEYPIVFAGNDRSLMPAVILGVRGSENLFIGRDGQWQANYIPAFVRRYPFVFSQSQDGDRLLLCVDEAFSGFNREGRGERLFDEDGKPTPYVDNILKFLQEYQVQFRRTQLFCERVRELNLVDPMQAQVEVASGEKMALGGFMAVERTRLKEVPGDKLAEMAKTDELELLYLHLQSMRNFNMLRDRLATAEAAKREEAGTESGDAAGAAWNGASGGTE